MLYTVGVMAKIIGVPASTLRYYDQEGLLPFVERSSGGIRMFTEKNYEWLMVIECLKKSGLSIKEIKAFIDMTGKGNESLPERLELFRSRKETVKKQMEVMQDTPALLEVKCWYYEQAIRDGTEEIVNSLPIDEIPEQHRNIRKRMSTIHPDDKALTDSSIYDK